MLVINPLIPFSQVISNKVRDSRTANDSIKCFTYKEARQIITDLRKLPIKDSIISRYDSIVKIDSIVIYKHENTIDLQRVSIHKKTVKIEKLKQKRKIFVIFGVLLGFSTQLLF